ncbi:MAG TPA: family 43 glycosylhydrolase, partial [Tepidisphaeraceae bacterium]|nr:family 43 glycosylhydrolase [Tepidisphaeraceae bacterium]
MPAAVIIVVIIVWMSVLVAGEVFVHAQSVDSSVWVADQGDGTYRNPILFADYSDPDVIRVGDDFWLTSSSFHCTPGLPILHSRD